MQTISVGSPREAKEESIIIIKLLLLLLLLLLLSFYNAIPP